MRLNKYTIFCLLWISFLFPFQLFAQQTGEGEIIVGPQIQAMPLMANFKNYVLENLYQQDTSLYSQKGKVAAQFVVEKDGSLTSVKILKGINSRIDSMVVNIIQQSPKWEPGREGGEVVRSRKNILIEFVNNYRELMGNMVYEFPDSVAKFNGDYNRFIQDSVNYPERAFNAGIEAKVLVSFIVEKNGKVSEIYSMEKRGWGFDEEVARIIYLMPNWIPAYHKGVAVRSYQTKVIEFRIDN